MAEKWEHPHLGTFEYDGVEWARPVDVPAFRAFEWRTKDRCELTFESHDETPPKPAEVKLADKVLANQARLVPKVIDALWNDFKGRGPRSGMWWHGDVDGVGKAAGMKTSPKSAIDLLSLMRPYRITIRREGRRGKPPLAEISFHAAFEEEHGVGVLVDGTKVVGTGYSTDCEPFKVSPPRSGRRR